MIDIIESNPGFLNTCVLDGRGGADSVDIQTLPRVDGDQGVLWIHLDVNDDT